MDLSGWSMLVVDPAAVLANVPPPQFVLLYFGPESVMPLGSFLAAAVGMVLLFWRGGFSMARRGVRRVFGKRPSGPRPGGELQGPDVGQNSPSGRSE